MRKRKSKKPSSIENAAIGCSVVFCALIVIGLGFLAVVSGGIFPILGLLIVIVCCCGR